jgi:dTDP-4-dehydrorhamnose reductase
MKTSKKNSNIARLLVTGGNGQIGWSLQHTKTPFEIISLTRKQLDITEENDIKTVFAKYNPHLVINSAAYTAVDKAEEEAELAFKINKDGAGLIAKCCAAKNIPLVHLSTDYVFDGEQPQPYYENDSANPLGIYGKSKLDGENLIRKHLESHLILRVSGVFAKHGNNFVKTILRLAQERKELNVVADQITCPTPAIDIAEVILQLAQELFTNKNNIFWGTYHYCAANPVSWYDFATAIVEQAKQYKNLLVEKLNPITTDQYPTLAKRPMNTVLNCDKLHQTFGIKQKPWQPGLNQTIKELLS